MAQTTQDLNSLFDNPQKMWADDIYAKISGDPIAQDPVKSQYSVFIKPTSGQFVVQGLLTNNFSLNLNATWEASGLLETITSNVPILSSLYPVASTILNLGGMADPASLGVSSKKVYKQSGYLEFDVEFRVLDWQGTGEPVKSAFMLSTLVLPTKDAKYDLSWLLDATRNAYKWTAKTAGNVSAATDKFGTQGAINGLKAIASLVNGKEGGTAEENENSMKNIKDKLTNNLGNLLTDDLYVAASEPSEITIDIGKYFSRKDMIVTGISCDFSKLCTDAGPLYADFKVSVSSRHSLLLDNSSDSEPELGLLGPQNMSRVSYAKAGYK
jgi:hypothetical protein